MLNRRLIRPLVVAVVATALLAPSAVAMPDYPIGPVPAPPSAESISEPTPPSGPAVRAEVDESSGFDWGSAAVGAGVAVVLLLLAGAGASATGHRRRAAAR